MYYDLTEETFVMYAMKHYDNPDCRGVVDFEDDLKRFSYLKRLFRKHTSGKDLKEKLIINHLIVIYNLFGIEAATNMLFFKIEKAHWSKLKTFLTFLNYLPVGYVINTQDCTMDSFEIPLDEKILNKLKRI